jgi:hypothetical protein
MSHNKYFKTTKGKNIQVFVAKAIAYSTQATYQLFILNAAEGEIGVFIPPADGNESNATLNAADNALTGLKFFIAQKRDGLVNKTPTYSYSEISPVIKAYVAPVKQVTNVGFDGTSGAINSGTLIPGQIFPIKVIETTPLNQQFPTWNFEETAIIGDTIQSIFSRLVKQMNDSTYPVNGYNGRIVSAALFTDGTFTVNTVGSGNVGVTNGSTTVTATGHNVTKGSYVRIGGTTNAFPVYKVKSVATNSFELESPYTGATNAALAIASLGTMSAIVNVGIQMTAIDFGAHFKVAVGEDMVSATVTYTTPYKEGSGTYIQVKDLESEGQVFAGHTTGNVAFDTDFGAPTYFADANTTYSYITLNYLRSQVSVAAPKNRDHHYGTVIIAAPTGVAPLTNLDGMFV